MDFRIVQEDDDWYDTVGVYDGDELLTTYAVPLADDLFEYVLNRNLDPKTLDDCERIIKSFTEAQTAGLEYLKLTELNKPVHEAEPDADYEHHLDEMNGGYSHFAPKIPKLEK
jgi:hypothetical protein